MQRPGPTTANPSLRPSTLTSPWPTTSIRPPSRRT
jgi:hypothetical protein